MSRHTLSVLVENRPAVLTRVAALFARRGFNIHSLAVGPTEDEKTSRPASRGGSTGTGASRAGRPAMSASGRNGSGGKSRSGSR